MNNAADGYHYLCKSWPALIADFDFDDILLAAWDVLCASAADCPSVASGPMLCEKGTCACPSKGSMPAVLTMVGDDLQCKGTAEMFLLYTRYLPT